MAKHEAAAAAQNETVPIEVFEALQSKREMVINVSYHLAVHVARALHWRCLLTGTFVFAEQELAKLDKEILQITKELSALKKEVAIPTSLIVSDPCGGFSLLACVVQPSIVRFPHALRK